MNWDSFKYFIDLIDYVVDIVEVENIDGAWYNYNPYDFREILCFSIGGYFYEYIIENGDPKISKFSKYDPAEQRIPLTEQEGLRILTHYLDYLRRPFNEFLYIQDLFDN